MNSFVKAGRRFGIPRPVGVDGPLAGGKAPERLAPMRISEAGGTLDQRGIVLATAPRWHIACAQPLREGQAEAELIGAGFLAYCPREIRHIGNYSQRREAERPLFPRYLFFTPRAGHGEALACRSVHSVLCDGAGRWASAHPSIVAAIAATETAGGFHAPLASRARLRKVRKGDSVKIASGPLAGWMAEVISIEPGKRLRLLVNMLGGKVEATSNLDKVSLIDQP